MAAGGSATRLHRHRVSELLGPSERTRNSFYSSSRPSTGLNSPCMLPEASGGGAILSALGDITNKLCSVQSSISSLTNKVDDLSAKTDDLGKRVASIEETTEEQPPRKKRKIQIPPELSTIIRRLYKNLDEDKKFNTSEKIDSNHNYNVADSLLKQITIAGKYTNEHLVTAAMKRYFISQVRASKSTTPEEGKKKRIVSRRTKLFERRSKFIKDANERTLWKHMTSVYMSDEETDYESEGFIIRKPLWRSDLLNKLLLRLDKRYDDQRKSATRRKPREKRKIGTFSIRKEPQGVPKWALKKTQSPSSSGSLSSNDSSIETPHDQDSIEPGCSSSSLTPTSIPGHTAKPTYLFDDSSDDIGSSDEQSDDEFSTMIRAAMKLY